MLLNSSRRSLTIPALTLPLEFRKHLSIPQGTLHVNPKRGEIAGLEALVSVGDVVSSRHKTSIKIFDYKSKRQVYTSTTLIDVRGPRIAINPPGVLSLNAITIIHSTRRGHVFVIGEEDLLVIPLLSRGKTSILYGQPSTGVVRVESDINMALKILKILKPTMVTYMLGEF